MAKNHRILEKSLEILEYVASQSSGVNMTRICEKVNMPLSSASPLLNTMVNMRYLSKDQHSSLYRVSLKAFEVGTQYVENSTQFQYTREVLEDLIAETRETAHMAILDGRDVVYISKFDTSHAVRMVSIIGRRIPAHATAIGKAMLSELCNDEIRALYAGRTLEALTEHTITDIEELIRQIERTRIAGYAMECGESSRGIGCVAVPVCGKSVIGTMAISLSIALEEGKRIDQFVDTILRAKQRLLAVL